jgi:hypothetical protein
MMMGPKPNLFTFATSELSQDAIVAWLLAWADPSHAHHDVALHGTAVALLKRLIDLCGLRCPDQILSVIVGRQYQKIDIVAVVNQRLALCIEDKINTSEHSDQLPRYRAIMEASFGKGNVGCVYFKTGDQGSYKSVTDAGFVPFGRTDILDVLRSGRDLGLRNHIIEEFVEYLESWDAAVRSFRAVHPAEWARDRRRWIGFFLALQERLKDANWGYVANASGGFMGLWWHWKDNKYLQLEEAKLCFKLQTKDVGSARTQRDEWYERLMQASAKSDMKLKRSRFRCGKFITVAVATGDYRMAGSDGKLDLDSTVNTLRAAEAILDDAAAE